jgi:aspartate racemase
MVRTFGPALTAAVGELGRAAQATPFMVWLAAFQSLLYRASRQDDIVVGAPIAGRSRPETQGVIGHFANTLALRARFADDPSFTELLAQVRDGCLRAYEHQEIPFERVARTLRAETARAMEFNIAFVLQESGGAELALGDLALEPHAVSGSTAKFDLTLSMSETPDGVRAALEYRSDLFDAATAEALLARYERIVRSALASPDVAVSRLALLTSNERELILGGWRGTRVDYPRDATIHDLFAEQARKSPDAVAVVHGARALTYGELDLQANQLANRLRALGVGPDVPVAICVSRSIEMVVGVLGILKAGGAYVPLDPSYPTQRLALIVGDARPRVILTEDALVARLSASELADIADRPVVLRLDGDWSSIASESDSAPASGATAESLAYVIYTSGSTGTPKGVAAVHRGVTRLAVNPTYVRLGSSETLLSFAPLSFDASTLELWGALCTGGRLVIFPGDAPSLAELGDVIAQHGVTTLWLTAALFHQFVDEHLDGLRPVRQLLAGGDVLSVPHVRRVLDAIPGCTLINGYGPTENTTFTCCHPVPRDAELGATVPIGRPIGNTTVYIVDRWMEPVPWGVPGRLYTGGDGLARGYLGMPELTAERFLADPFDATPGARVYDTGDLARWRSDGTVEFLGRADTQLKIRGFRIEPGEVESALLGEPDVQEAVVVAREVTSGDKRLVAYVVPRAGARLDVVAIRSRLAERLPAFMVPSVVLSLDALPLTSSGKVDRRALPAPPAAGEGAAVVPPRNDVERVVARTFGEVLGHEPASVESSFFDLGGHSLLAIRVVAQVLKIFRTRLPLRRFFDDPTVAGVSRAIVAEEAKPGHAAAIAAMLIKIQSMSPAEREQLRRDRARPDQSSR